MKLNNDLNPSGLEPVGVAVLVAPYEPEIRASMIALPPSVKERNTMVEQRAVVIAVGSEAWADERQPRAVVGDRVLIAKFAGHLAVGTKDGKQYRLVNDRDIFCRIGVS